MQLLSGVATFVVVILASLWVGCFIWIHQPLGRYISLALMGLWGLLTIAVLVTSLKSTVSAFVFSHQSWLGSFSAIVIMAIICFFAMSASNERDWNPEVAQMLDYQLANDGKTLTVDNVRNFDWHDTTHFQPRWETRQYDLTKLQRLDLIASYWMGDAIAHTLMSFGFSDGQQLVLSIEIRKEVDEEFSTLGGFFRKFELVIIAADEKDIIYTRSNIRHEDVYIYPISMDKDKISPLLLAYLQQAKTLKTQPIWYNSLLNNCTTGIYRLIKDIQPLPFDYRLVLSGYIPSYLYDHRLIDHRYSLQQWQRRAHINPKSQPFSAHHPISSAAYSQLIRNDF